VKKLISYVVIFVLGFGACALILNQMGYIPSSGGRSVIDGLTAHPMPPIGGKGGNPIVQAVAKVGPAVVNIDTVTERRVESPFPSFIPIPMPAEKQVVTGQGSGVIISKDGYVLTNNHVVAGARDISVRLEDGRKFKARVVGRDGFTDLAVLKVNGNNLPSAKLGDSDALRVGDWAIAIGNPLGFGSSVSVGVISAKKRTDLPVGEGQRLKEAIQTDAAINRGNSGGALANINGEVIGINTAIASTEPGQGSIGIGFAIPINYARGTVKDLIAEGKIVRPYLGVIVSNLQGDLADWYKQHGFTAGQAAIVYQVQPGGPAAKAGLMQWDVITYIDKSRVRNADDVTKIIQRCKPGQVVRLTVWRENGGSRILGAKLVEMPQDMP
jgi:serine protease Do